MGDAHSDLNGENDARRFWEVVTDVVRGHEYDTARSMIRACNSVLYVKCKVSDKHIAGALAWVDKCEHAETED